MKFWYKTFKIILKPFYKLYYNPKIYDKENLEVEGPVIYAANHMHLMDQCNIIINTKRVITYMAKKEYFDSIKTRWFFKMVGCIPVDRSIHDENAKNKALEILKNGGAIGIFPEGTRNKTKEKLLPFKFGAVSLANKSNATIVPIAISGTYKFRSKDLKIKVGEPFKVKNNNLEEANNHLYKMVLKMLDELNVYEK